MNGSGRQGGDEAADIAWLEALLEDSARGRPGADEAFLSRVLVDALDQQEARRPMAAPTPGRAASRGRPGPGAFATLGALLRGRWQVASGLATAGLAGVWLGFAAPGLASGLTGAEDQEVAMLPSYELAATFLDQSGGGGQ